MVKFVQIYVPFTPGSQALPPFIKGIPVPDTLQIMRHNGVDQLAFMAQVDSRNLVPEPCTAHIFKADGTEYPDDPETLGASMGSFIWQGFRWVLKLSCYAGS
jgi:hypothetical protein